MRITFRKRRRRSRRRKRWLKTQHQLSPQSAAAVATTITAYADNQQRCRRVVGVVRLFLAAYLLIGSGEYGRYGGVTAVAESCPSFCECKWKDGKESVICVNANLTSIPTKLDATGVLVLHLAGNLLFKLSNDVFFSSGFSNLQKLYLVRCNIKYIEPRAFYMLKNLVDLDLSENAFSIVPSLAFLPVPDLRELKLNGNYILKIGGYAFVNVRRLVQLEISHCRIGYVDENAFSGLENTLRVLKLNKNRLYNVQPRAFTSFKALQTLDLSENPLNCTCELRPLRDWMYEKGLSTHGTNVGSGGSLPICHFAHQKTNVSWHQLSADDFACLPSVYAPSRAVTAYEGDNVTLACRIDGGSPMPKMTWTLRNRVLSNSTFGYPVTDKRSYLIHSVADNYSNLTILSLEMQDTGEYVCVAENKAGKVIADVALTIEKAPIGTIISERMVLIGIVATTVSTLVGGRAGSSRK